MSAGFKIPPLQLLAAPAPPVSASCGQQISIAAAEQASDVPRFLPIHPFSYLSPRSGSMRWLSLFASFIYHDLFIIAAPQILASRSDSWMKSWDCCVICWDIVSSAMLKIYPSRQYQAPWLRIRSIFFYRIRILPLSEAVHIFFKSFIFVMPYPTCYVDFLLGTYLSTWKNCKFDLNIWKS